MVQEATMSPLWRDLRTAFHLPLLLSVLALAVLLAGCTGGTAPREAATPYPILEPTTSPGEVSSLIQSSAPASTYSSAPKPLPLELWSPQDGAETDIGVVRVLGKTRVDAAVAINGIPIDVASDGTFQRDLRLEEGANLIEVASVDVFGELEYSAYKSVVVFSTASTEGLPLSIFSPLDGLRVREAKVRVIGGTREDALVVVNGDLVGLNELGIFATEVALEEGANLIEVINEDIEQRINFRRVEVFYLR